MEPITIATTVATAKKFVTALIDAKVGGALQAQGSQLLGEIIALQITISGLVKEKDAAHEEAQEYKNRYLQLADWNAQAARYELKEIATGVFVYASKNDTEGTDPAHWLCPNCYQDRNKSILQRKSRDWGGTTYACPRCSTSICDHADCSEVHI